jgi:hypothetical protein
VSSHSTDVRTILSSGAKTALGAIAFASQGRTPPFAYRHMLQLFFKTGGVSNDAMSSLLALKNWPYRLPDAKGVLGDLSKQAIETVGSDIRERGYHVFEQRLPEALCDELLNIATSRSCVQRRKDGDANVDVEVSRFPRENPSAVRYDFAEDLLVNEPLIQGLLADRSIISVAQNYLRCSPIIDIVAMWWNAASLQPDKQAAQYWHFDMDRIKWLKFFIYLTDVGPNNGPHSFVEGSHRTRCIPPELLNKGYARLTDAEVSSHFSPEKFIEFTGPRGTIIAEDTRGLHKGKHVTNGDRLIFQMQFTNSLFGGETPVSRIERVSSPALAGMVKRYPRVYSSYIKGEVA